MDKFLESYIAIMDSFKGQAPSDFMAIELKVRLDLLFEEFGFDYEFDFSIVIHGREYLVVPKTLQGLITMHGIYELSDKYRMGVRFG